MATKPNRSKWNTGTGINEAGDRYIGFVGEGHFEAIARIDDVDEDMLQKLLDCANNA